VEVCSDLLFLFLVFSAPLVAAEAPKQGALKVKVNALSAILMNADTGAILFEKDPHLLSYPASVTKIATALYVLEKKGGALDESVTVPHESVKIISPVIKQAAFDAHPPHLLESDGTMMRLKLWEILSLKVLLYGMMLVSGMTMQQMQLPNICSGDI
jgi:D-alanyl-D-alanine carboxypeptidase (penicillin-binding protein 5/6)